MKITPLSLVLLAIILLVLAVISKSVLGTQAGYVLPFLFLLAVISLIGAWVHKTK